MVFQVGFRKQWEPNMAKVLVDTPRSAATYLRQMQSEQGGSKVKQLAAIISAVSQIAGSYCYSTVGLRSYKGFCRHTEIDSNLCNRNKIEAEFSR